MVSVFLGLGSNIEREKHILAGIIDIAEHFQWLQRSRVYESRAVGFDGSNFYNLVVEVQTHLSVQQVQQRCKQIEQDHGRSEHSPKYSPRTLDIDLLLYGELCHERSPQLPRAEILHNAFVLRPLAEIAPDRVHPICGESYQQLWQAYQQQHQANHEQWLRPLSEERWLPF
ncbi:MAG: 2-amino-4-hydroxy-6-hydroxymethyldihydropteridine diphosphokinase [Idiomarina sp.]|uniref:2-amino-4-hydroxy-6- hydroxymethyldihydropteridine diphosphokinase n=1 Tax=Idiomarina sp. TaxID=1874361 RepID=UPI000C106547|nr:2-amino-4-hydroxy-6-hydroxymethyldihydropteridine diphosphokinase [Idiomarina sp.]MBL4741431.1 2-amino-4-hydroxy-6-hydroxymethyldihydropteridine diphosphokinase [Idiomarina sp.]PHQ77943.1 MAG: 2-amino-4-hydroxy-6-hydroxymethyldihydropteridine diphosphokinase [Idiomarina sp.]